MHISLAAETLFHLGGVPITNSFLTSMISTFILILLGLMVGMRYQKLPSGMQHIFEMVYEAFDDLAIGIIGEKGRKYTPLAVTFFLYIIFSNWLSLLPGVGSLGLNMMEHGEEVFVPFFRGGNADLNTTLALALVSVGATQVYGVQSSGLLKHLHHFTNPLEIVGEFSKILSFGFRLFGNVFAGEVLLLAGASMLMLVTGKNLTLYGIPGGLIQTPFLMLEFFVGFIQAFIFAVLTLSFISVYVQEKMH
jgi:F-type H+-transporting ATPase subunit a